MLNGSVKPVRKTVTEKVITDVNDFLIVRKIPEICENVEPEIYPNEIDVLVDENLLADEYEASLKRQLQILQATERGKKALSNEIAEIKKLQEKRAEYFNLRKKAVEKERERSKRIAALPPPLSQSIKTLLKEKDSKKKFECKNMNERTEKSDAEFDGLLGIPASFKRNRAISESENKENMSDSGEIARKKLQEAERDARALKRYNEAIRKARMQQECAETLKAIENAEQTNRRFQAKNISTKGGTVPCHIPDTLKKSEKQIEMEDAVESIFRNTSKEYAIEDLEGYKDEWEIKYKKIDSPLNTKLIDCVPKFVKDNYSYLLEDESLYQCGKRFSGLNESSDDLNTAYIESPTETVTDKASSSDEINTIIHQLDNMRAESNEQYEREFMPLLQEHKEKRKPTLVDKAVETNILKQPTVDKSIENCSILLHEKPPSASRSIQVDLSKGGIIAFQRKNIGSKFMTPFQNFEESLESKSTKQVAETPKKTSSSENWSSSSYMSLPSHHGMPELFKSQISPGWDVPLTEKQESRRECIPLAKAPPKINSASNQEIEYDKLSEIQSEEGKRGISAEKCQSPELQHIDIEKTSQKISFQNNSKTDDETDRKFKLSYFVKKVADKYLKDKIKISSPSSSSALLSLTQFMSESPCQEENGNFGKEFISLETEAKMSERDKSFTESKTPELPSDLESLFEISQQLDESKSISDSNISKPSLQEIATQFESNKQSCLTVPKVISGNVESNEPIQVHNFHNLSTIPEIDSVLTNESGFSLTNVRKDASAEKLSKNQVIFDRSSHRKSVENINITKISLIKPPPSEIPELAKSIKFVDNMGSPSTGSFPSVVSGTLTDLVTPILSPSLYMSSANGSSENHVRISPHLADSEHSFLSSLSTVSQKTPYSSSFQDPRRRPPYLTDSESLPRYFKEVSTVKQGRIIKYHGGFEMSPYSAYYSRTPVHEKKVEKSIQEVEAFPSSESSAGSFQKLSSQSYSSTLTDHSKDNSGESKKFTSSVHSKNREKMRDLISDASTGNNWDSIKPKAPFLYLPSPSQIKSSPSATLHEYNSPALKLAQKKELSYGLDNKNKTIDSEESFKNITPYSYSACSDPQISIPITSLRSVSSKIQSLESPSQSEINYGCKKVPSETKSMTFPPQISPFSQDYPSSVSEGKNFEYLTPHSNISSPTENATNIPSSSVYNIHYKTPTSTLMKRPVTLRLEFLSPNSAYTSNISIDGPNAQNSDFKKNHNNINFDRRSPEIFNLKTNIEAQKCSSDVFTPILAESDVQSMMKTVNIDMLDGRVPQLFNPNHMKVEHSEPLSLSCEEKEQITIKAHPCSSDYFIPQLNEQELGKFKKPNIPKQMKPLKQSHSAEKPFLRQLNSVIKEDESNPRISVESKASSSNKAGLYSTKPKSNVIKMLDKNEVPKIQLPFSAVISSLDAFTTSKINFQSTPLKCLEEITKEPGILEEPDLTLMRSELTLKPESPRKKQIISNYTHYKKNISVKAFTELSPHTTPINAASASKSHPFDSPSLLSFMQHEMSCYAPEISADASAETRDSLSNKNVLDIITPSSSPKKTPKSIEKKGLSSTKKTPGKEYKTRTKRLWNNLEEVKSKKQIEERKEQMIKNRLKMKAYSKKLGRPKPI